MKPWQRYSADAVKFALEQINTDKPAGYRIAFLILDMSAELIMKTYLGLPQRVVKAKTAHKVRVNGAKGNFHEILESVAAATEDDYIKENIDSIQYYHNIRNRIYHESAGITVETDDVKAYSVIVAEILYRLLGVDLRNYLRELKEKEKELKRQEEKERKKQRAKEEKLTHKKENEEREQRNLLKELKHDNAALLEEFKLYMECIVELLNPTLLTPSFWLEAERIREDYLESHDVPETERRLTDLISQLFQIDITDFLSEYVDEEEFKWEQLYRYDMVPENDKVRLLRIIKDIPLGNHILDKMVLKDFLSGKTFALAHIMWKLAPCKNQFDISESELESLEMLERLSYSPKPYNDILSYTDDFGESVDTLAGGNELLRKGLVTLKRFYIAEKNRKK